MKKIKICLIIYVVLVLISCSDDFLDRAPLSKPSMETFWTKASEAEYWVNNLYRINDGDMSGWIGAEINAQMECFSDNAYGSGHWGKNNIVNGLFDPFDSHVEDTWEGCYQHIRLSLEFLDNIDRVPDITQSKKDELEGQVRFMLAYQYYLLMMRFRDVPLITKCVLIKESDVEKASKAQVLAYIFEQLDIAIEKLPIIWPQKEAGRVTKGAALFLKTRIELYNELWSDAVETAQQLMDLKLYELQPNFEELFLVDFNNKKKEVILEIQYAKNLKQHNLYDHCGPTGIASASGTLLPLPELEESFEMIDGLSIDESPLFNPTNRFANRDPRYYTTFTWYGQHLRQGGLVGVAGTSSKTHLYFNKFLLDFKDTYMGYLNWNLFRYADLLLMYAEAKNELSGPDNSIYEALDLIRERAGMPPVDRNRYNNKTSLRSFIRNERRVELAGEGLRYNDILRWKIAPEVLNKTVMSLNLEGWIDMPYNEDGNPKLNYKQVEIRAFDPNKHYVWPIPQEAIDRAKNLKQHSEWE